MLINDYAKNYYHKHRVKILEDQKRRRQNDDYREKLKNYYREYYRKNRVKILEQSKLRRQQGEFYCIKCPGNAVDRTIKIIRGNFTITFD